MLMSISFAPTCVEKPPLRARDGWTRLLTVRFPLSASKSSSGAGEAVLGDIAGSESRFPFKAEFRAVRFPCAFLDDPSCISEERKCGPEPKHRYNSLRQALYRLESVFSSYIEQKMREKRVIQVFVGSFCEDAPVERCVSSTTRPRPTEKGTMGLTVRHKQQRI